MTTVIVAQELFEEKIVIKIVDAKEYNMCETSTTDMMDFLKMFKNAVDDKFETSDKKNEVTTERIEKHLGKIDSNMEKLKADLTSMEEKNKAEAIVLNKRLVTLKEDMRRLNYARLRSPTRRED